MALFRMSFDGAYPKHKYNIQFVLVHLYVISGLYLFVYFVLLFVSLSVGGNLNVFFLLSFVPFIKRAVSYDDLFLFLTSFYVLIGCYHL